MAPFSFVTLVLALTASMTFALSNFAGHQDAHGKLARSHGSGNLTTRMSTSQRDWKLNKRFDGARCTNFVTGLGACGQTNVESDFVVALNSEQYGNGEHCFETITITYNGKSTQAQIVDRCPECSFGALDLTNSLFQFFSSLDQGVFYASWTFGSGSSSPTTTSSTSTPPPSPTTSSTPSPEPTTSSTSTSSSSESSTSTSSSSSSPSTSSSSSQSGSSTESSTSTSSTATPTATSASNVLELVNVGAVQLGALIKDAAQANFQV